MRSIIFLGRFFYSAIFILASFGHFTDLAIEHARRQGVLMPEILVPVSGVIALLGGLSILFGYKARYGAWLLVLFLIPVTIMMHDFWAYKDPIYSSLQLTMFLKNISMLGAALLITQYGVGESKKDSS